MTNFPSKEILLSVDLDEVFQTPFLIDWGRRDFNSKPEDSIAGDCFLLPYKNHQKNRYDYILVDSGLSATYKNNQIQTILKALGYINPGGVITGIILTHTDEDHIGGLTTVASTTNPVSESIYAHVKWIVVGMTYLASAKVSNVWINLAGSFVERNVNSWNMERVLVPTTQPTPPGQEPQPTPEECKEHIDTISRRIFCQTNGQVLVRSWNLLNEKAKVTDETPPFKESMYYYEKRDPSLIDSGKSTQNVMQNMDIVTLPRKAQYIDKSHTNKSSISTVYYSYGGSSGISHYYCFNGDTLLSLSHLFTIGLPHNHSIANFLFMNRAIIEYPYNIPEEMGEEDIDKLARVYDKAFTMDIHYKFQSMIEVVDDVTTLIDAMNKALVPPGKRMLVYIYLLQFKVIMYDSLKQHGLAINKWDGFQLPHHGSCDNSLGIDNFSIFPIGSTTSNPSNKLISTIDSTKLATTYQQVSNLFFVTSAGTNNHMAKEYRDAFSGREFNDSKVLVPYPSVIQTTGKVKDEHNLFSNDPTQHFFTLSRLYMYIFWNFAPIFPASLSSEYHQLAQVKRVAYGISNGHQLINLPDFGKTDDQKYDANLEDLKKGIKWVSDNNLYGFWDRLTKSILRESLKMDKAYLLPKKPIEIKSIEEKVNYSMQEALAKNFVPGKTRSGSSHTPSFIFSNMMIITNYVSDLVPIADWLHSMWLEIDKIELSTHTPDLFESSGAFQSIGKTIISDERFFPIILDGLNFSFNVDTSHDQLITVVRTTGLIEHPTSHTDSTPTTTLVTVDLLRTKTVYSDYTPTYELDITLENGNIINILPTSQSDGKKKNLKVLSNEIKNIDKQFSTYDDNPSTIQYTLNYDKDYSLDELTKLSKIVTPELTSLTFYVEDAEMSDGIIVILQDQSDEELVSSNVEMLYVRNFVISEEKEGEEEEDEEKEAEKSSIDKYVIKLSFFIDFDANNNDQNTDKQYFIQGSFSLQHIISNGKKKPILFSDLCRDIIFSGHNNFILDDFLLDIFAKYPFLYSSFNKELDSLLSMLSIRQLSGSFFGSITDLTTIQSFFSVIQFSSFESIVQFTPPKELHIFQDIKLPLQNINFYFQLEYDYESKSEINPFPFEVKYHSLKLEGEFVIQASDTSTYKINVLYSFGGISSLEVKKSRFIQDNLTTNMNMSGFKDAFGIEDGLIPPISFFDDLMGYLPDYLRITLYDDYSFGGIEAKFMKADISFSLTKQIEVSKFTLALEYFPNLNTDVFAIAEFHKVSTDENNSSRELLGTLSFNYEYKNKQGSIEVSLQLNSNTSVYQIIGLFVEKFNVEDLPASLENFSLREISVRFNLTTKVLEKFHIRIDSKISLSFIAEYLTLARLDITYLSSRLFLFEGLLESKSTSYLVTIRRISFSDQGTCWRLEGISTQKLTTIANFTDIYTKLKKSTTAEEFVNVILEEIHVNEIILDIEKYTEAESDIKKTRILFYAEINSLKLAFIYDNGSVNVLSTLKFLIQKDPVSLNTVSSISNLTHPLRSFPQLSIQNKNVMSVDMKNVDTCVDVKGCDNDGVIVLHQQHPPSQYSLITQQYDDEHMLKYQSPNAHIQVLDEVVNEVLGEPQVSLDKLQTCLIPSFSEYDDQILHNIPPNVSQRKAFSHTLSRNIDAIVSTDIDTHIDTYINTYINTYSATDEEKDHTKEVEYLGSYSTAINTMQFLFSAKEFTIGCVYMNKLQPKSYAQHESIKNMVEGTLRDLRLDSNTQEKTLIAFSFRCISKLITGLRNPKKKIDDPDTETPIVSVEDTLLFAFLVEVSPQLLFEISAHFIATESPIRFGDWFALTSIGIVAYCTLPSDGLPIATISLFVEGKIPNGGPVLKTTISGSLEGVQILCKLEIQISRWIQPFAINWLFLNVTMSGSLVVSPVVVLDTVKFEGQFYVIPRDLQAIIKTMDVEEAFARILTDPFLLEATLIADLRSPRFHFKAKVTGLSFSRILNDIFLQDIAGAGFSKVVIVDNKDRDNIQDGENIKDYDALDNFESYLEADYQIGTISNLNLQGHIYIQVGEFKLFLKAGYKASTVDKVNNVDNVNNMFDTDSNLILNSKTNLLTTSLVNFKDTLNINHDTNLDLQFKAVGAMSKVSLFGSKVIIQSYTSATNKSSTWEQEILDFIPPNIKDRGDFKDGALFAISLTPQESYFLFNGAITICSLLVAFSGKITKDVFRIKGLLQIGSVLELALDIELNFSGFSFHSSFSYSLSFKTPPVKYKGILIFKAKEITINLGGAIHVNISDKKAQVSVDASFQLVVQGLEVKISFDFGMEIENLNNLYDLIKSYIITHFEELVLRAIRHLLKVPVKLLVVSIVIIGVLFLLSYTGPGAAAALAADAALLELIQIYDTTLESGTIEEKQPLLEMNSDAYAEQLETVLDSSDGDLLSNNTLYKAQKRGHSVYSLLGLQNNSTPIHDVNAITNQMIKNVRSYLSTTFTPQTLIGTNTLFMVDDELFDIGKMSGSTKEQIIELFSYCDQITTNAISLLALLSENNTISAQPQDAHKIRIRATPRENIVKIVNKLPAYYRGLKRISEILLHQWFISENMILPILFQQLVTTDTSKSLFHLISSAIMKPFILHLEFFSILLHNLQAVLGLITSTEDKKVFDGRVINIYCMTIAQAVLARHYNTALLYPNIHANGTLVKVDGIDCVILDSRLYKIPSFIKTQTKEANIIREVNTHVFQKAIRHSTLMPAISSILVSPTSDIAKLCYIDDGGTRKYAISIHRHLRFISHELLTIIRDNAKIDAPLVDQKGYAPGLPLYRSTSFLKGFATGFKNRTLVHSEVSQLVWSSVDYEYGSISLNSFLYPAIITVTEIDSQVIIEKIFRLTPNFIFKIDVNVPLQKITELYQECYILTQSQSAYHLTLSISELHSHLSEDIKRIVNTYKPTINPGSDLKTYLKNLPALKVDSKFQVVRYKSIPDPEKQFQLVFGTDNHYFYTKFPTRRPRSIQTEEAYKKLKNKPISPNQTIYNLSIDEQPSNYDADGNYKYEMKEGVYAIDDWDTIVTIPAVVTTITAGSFRNSNIKQVVFEAGSTLRTIEEYAFSGCIDLKSITIPASVSYISDTAFIDSGLLEMNFEPGTQLKSIFIPASVTAIGGTTTTAGAFQGSELKSIQFEEMSKLATIAENTFCECQALDSIIIPASVTIINNQAFKGSGLEDITFEEGTKITEIKAHAFHGCESLDSITIPATVVTIADSAFDNSGLTTMNFTPQTQLHSIHIPALVTTIGGTESEIGVFQDSNLETITFAPGSTLAKISANMFSGCKQLSEINIPASVIEICEFAFNFCEKLSEITIPASVATIGRYAFSESGLSTIYFADDAVLTIIRDFTFYKCINLNSITIPTSVITIEKDAFNSSGLDTMDFKPDTKIESVVIPAFVTKIADDAFKGSKLGTITFATGSILGEIGKNAFQGCSRLTSIDIPASVFEIGESAFRNSGLTKIEFDPQSLLNKLGPNAFYDCKRLTKIEIPKFLAMIEEYTFGNSALSSITYATGSILSKILPYAFDNCLSLTLITIPSSITILAFEGFASSLTSILFEPNTQVESIFIPASVTTISSVKVGDGAFKNSNLMEISFGIGSALKTIEANTFYGCKQLSEISIPASVTKVGESAFYGCKSLEKITIPALVNTISECAFKETGLKSIEFLGLYQLTTIESSVFYGCEELRMIKLPPAVTAIKANAFRDCKILSSVTFASESMLETIGANAFIFCPKLNKITIPASVTTIADSAFSYSGLLEMMFAPTTKLKSICIPASVTTISGINSSQGAFQDSSLESITFDDESVLKKIGRYTFDGCIKLSSISIPVSVSGIEQNAFSGCEILGSISIPASVAAIGNSAFKNCKLLGSIIFEPKSQLKTIDKEAFEFCLKLSKIVIPASVTCIGQAAFRKLNLTSVEFEPESRLQMISMEAFYECEMLCSITIPASVTEIGNFAFYSCRSLTHVEFEPNSRLETIRSNAFSTCRKLGNIKLPSSLIGIYSAAFHMCGAFTSITIPASITTLGAVTFEDCLGLTCVKFEPGSQLETIANRAFNGCKKLSTINLPASVTTIDDIAFGRCQALSAISIPASVKTISDTAFLRSGLLQIKLEPKTKLQSICIPASVTAISSTVIEEGAFKDSNLESITFEDGSALETIGINTFYGCKKFSQIKIPASVTAIKDNAFYGCEILDSVIFVGTPTNVTEISDNAFTDSNLSRITAEDGSRLKSIGKEAFADCTKLLSIGIPALVDEIGSYAFRGSGIKTITFAPNSVLQRMKINVLAGCINLEKITIPVSVITIEKDVFLNSNNLKEMAFSTGTKIESVYIPASIKFLAAGIFKNSNLKNITFAEGIPLPKIPTESFYGCVNLTSIEIPAACTTLGLRSFQNSGIKTVKFAKESIFTTFSFDTFNNCKNLTTIKLPPITTTLSARTFMNCTNLTTIHIPSLSSIIPSDTFRNSGLQSITFDENITSMDYIGVQAFQGCTKLTSIEIPSCVKHIRSDAFFQSGLKDVKFRTSSILQIIDTNAFRDCKSLFEINIPDFVTTIGTYAFFDCRALKKITIPASVTTIADTAFIRSGLEEMKFMPKTQLRSIFIPASVITISATTPDGGAFKESGLKEIVFEEESTLKSIDANTFYGCGELSRIDIPASVTEIHSQAFRASGLTTVEFHRDSSLKTMKTNILSECINLEKITIPTSVTTIEIDAFLDSNNLKEIVFSTGTMIESVHMPASIESLAIGIFKNSNLKNITFAEGIPLARIPTEAFYGCVNLTSIEIPAACTTLGLSSFQNSGIRTVQFAEGSIFTTFSFDTFNNCKNLTTIKLPSTTTTLSARTFMDCTSLTTIHIPSLSVAIPSDTFRNSDLQSITFDEDITAMDYIGIRAFQGCTKLTSIEIPSCVKHIRSDAFFQSGLKDVKFGTGSILQIIDTNVFRNCKSLFEINIPDFVTTIGKYAFLGCIALKSVTIPALVTMIEEGLFSGCIALTSVVTPNSLMRIESKAFYDCHSLSSGPLPSAFDASASAPRSLVYIGSEAFAYCRNLISITIPNSVTFIELAAFRSSGLGIVLFLTGSALIRINYYTFAECTNLVLIQIPASVSYIGEYAFLNARDLGFGMLSRSTYVTIDRSAFTGVKKRPTSNYIKWQY